MENFRMKNYELIEKYEQIMEHMKWMEEIPYISFPYEIKNSEIRELSQ